MILNVWELDPVMGFMILKGFGPFQQQMSTWGSEDKVLPKKMSNLVKF